MGSDWDYINEHMGGHDEDGLPNFMSEPGFSGDEYESTGSSKEDIGVEEVRSYYILENLIARIEIEGLSLSHITELEVESLRYALKKLSPEAEISSSTSEDYVVDDDIPF